MFFSIKCKLAAVSPGVLKQLRHLGAGLPTTQDIASDVPAEVRIDGDVVIAGTVYGWAVIEDVLTILVKEADDQ